MYLTSTAWLIRVAKKVFIDKVLLIRFWQHLLLGRILSVYCIALAVDGRKNNQHLREWEHSPLINKRRNAKIITIPNFPELTNFGSWHFADTALLPTWVTHIVWRDLQCEMRDLQCGHSWLCPELHPCSSARNLWLDQSLGPPSGLTSKQAPYSSHCPVYLLTFY